MTAQVYKGKTYGMNTEPLADYRWREPGPFGTRPSFSPRDSGCWRGYEGRWAIENGRLYMTHIEGYLDDGRKATLAVLFPGAPQPVFAEWFSGVLAVNDGEMLRYVHMGYESVYEHSIMIEVRAGCVTGERVRSNRYRLGPPEDMFREATPEELRSLLSGPQKSKAPGSLRAVKNALGRYLRSKMAKQRPGDLRSFRYDAPETNPPKKR